MIARATAIPLAIHPYSSTSQIVHWLTRNHGKISTLLKGAQRVKSPFQGEYELFSTSELLYFTKRADTLYTAKECALLQRRSVFRTDWRAMQTAAYLTTLIARTTPDEAPFPELFALYEQLLDLAELHGRSPQFLLWMELRFCDFHGHPPHLGNCLRCSAPQALRFCASQGGVVCAACSRTQKLPTLECPPDTLAILRAWQQADLPETAVKTRLSGRQLTQLNAIAGTFIRYHFNLPPEHRNAAIKNQMQ